VTGNVETEGSGYSGGAENFMRFLERWSGRTLNFEGSLVCMWESEQATGEWRYGSPQYTAPNRNWIYDIDLAHVPPAGVTEVYYVEKVLWRQE